MRITCAARRSPAGLFVLERAGLPLAVGLDVARAVGACLASRSQRDCDRGGIVVSLPAGRVFKVIPQRASADSGRCLPGLLLVSQALINPTTAARRTVSLPWEPGGKVVAGARSTAALETGDVGGRRVCARASPDRPRRGVLRRSCFGPCGGAGCPVKLRAAAVPGWRVSEFFGPGLALGSVLG